MHSKLNRWQAFGIHLAISLVIFLGVLAVMLSYWYPGVFINMGGWQGVKIVAGVDLVLGPVLTLIVFNPVKKSLKWDLSIIAAIQIGALSYGVWAVESQRIVAQVLLDDTLYVTAKSDYKEAGVSLDFAKELSGSYPKKVFIDLPEDHIQIATTLVTREFTGIPLQYDVEKYIAIEPSLISDELKPRLKWRLDRLKFDSQLQCFWLPVLNYHYTGEACFSPEKGAIKLRELQHTEK